MNQVFYNDWVGRQRQVEERIGVLQVAGLRAVLDDPTPPAEGEPPLGLQWLLCPDIAVQSRLGPDGHPARGDFLPPVALPRRMWAGGELRFHGTPRLHGAVVRHSTVKSVEEKSGRSGQLVFVGVEHQYTCDGDPWLTETQTLVYREASASASPPAPVDPADYTWREDLSPDPVLLFRYSALTFNGHRIHYDQPYATGEEGYRGLVVHGPLTATLLMRLAQRQLAPGQCLARFRFRGLSAAIVNEPLVLLGRSGGDGVELLATAADGRPVMEARAVVTAAAG